MVFRLSGCLDMVLVDSYILTYRLVVFWMLNSVVSAMCLAPVVVSCCVPASLAGVVVVFILSEFLYD